MNISVQRGLLAAVMGNPAFAPGVVDVYDLSRDCRHPELMASAPASVFGHESGMALDGRTFYPTSISTGNTTAVDLSNPRTPVPLGQWSFNTHGMSVSDDGNRGYLAARDGLIIVDLSEVQARVPNPEVREISRLTWSNMTIPQIAIPVTIGGKPYLVEIDEYSAGESGGSVASHGPRVGAARIIDISDERRPFVVSQIRLEVHQPENRSAIAGDPGARSPVQGYAGHYCNVPQRVEPGILACSMIVSGLRVFDIRDPENPKEIAYHVAPPSTVSETGGPTIDERANYAMSQPAFAPERGEIWYSDGTSGFYALRMDPAVWPFRVSRGADGCVARSLSVSARPRGDRVALSFQAERPVRIDVLRGGRRVARRSRPFTFRPRRAGLYVVRFTRAGERRVLAFRAGERVRVVRIRARGQAALAAGRDGHVPADQEREPADHALLRHVRLVREQLAEAVGEVLVVGHQSTGARRVTAASSSGSVRWLNDRRSVLAPPSPAWNGAPGTYATPAASAAGRSATASAPSGSVSHVRKPPAGSVQVTPGGMWRSSAADRARQCDA